MASIKIKLLAAVALIAAALSYSPSAEAWDGYYAHHHAYRHHASLGINIVGAGYYGPGFYNPYYAPQVVYMQPAPQMMYGAPVMQQAQAQQASDYCREYTTQVRTPNGPRTAYGTACMQPDGQWHIVN